MTYSEDGEDRAKKERSPSFPFISLPKALDRARAVSDAHRRNPARLTVVGETWGYGPSSSGLLQTVSALKAYGLIEDVGRGAERRIQLTDLAQRIIHDARPGAKEAALKEAALRPRLFAEYADKWLPERPSDGHCLSELRLDRGFTEAAAKTFLKSFDETVAFADLKGGDGLSVSEINDANSSVDGGESEVPPLNALVRVGPSQYATAPSGPQFSPGPSGPSFQMAVPHHGSARAQAIPPVPRATLPLPEGIAALEIPQGLSRKSFEALKAWVDVMVSLAERSIIKRWYVELYRPNSIKADSVHFVPNWEALKSFIADSKEAIPGVIIRVIAPEDAEQHELAELREMGARTF
ncbi:MULTISPECIES: hypothetical protein [unclassified Bradyrhizobium]|uniref:hypothetical protein n=1 Tax=unclassified Bradyrhizobium TaxID=2631580 RepID=UPI001CD47CE1|nr:MULTISPECIES: hypothetical protein [unclassified Bradyrhizobium]MCA1377645.1 hypothetical protein [Bradyrhizobium sp. IC4060]MCA1483128.1 hypothetical protein [Bradyrhizobium sp. IC4061]